MKNKLLLILTSLMLICLCLFGLTACNDKPSVQTESQLKFVMNTDGKTVSVDGIGMYFERDLIIPSTYKGYAVTAITDNAFENCEFITSVTISDSVTSIGRSAFDACDSLMSVTIGDSVTSIGDRAFYACGRLVEVINKSSNITVEKGSSNNGYVGYYAFSVSNGDDNYVNKFSTDSNGYVIYTDGEDKILVNYVGEQTELVLPSDITKINEKAFYKNYKITSVTISSSVTSIGRSAFYNCTSLTSITFSDTSTWYRTNNYNNWNNKTSGTQTDLTTPTSNDDYFKSSYYGYYWYKL